MYYIIACRLDASSEGDGTAACEREDVVDAFDDDSYERAVDRLRFLVARDWYVHSDYTRYKRFRLTRFPCGSTWNDNLHVVSFRDVLLLNPATFLDGDRDRCREYVDAVRRFVARASSAGATSRSKKRGGVIGSLLGRVLSVA